MLIALLSTLIVLCAVLLISFLWERRKCLRMQQRLFRESRKLERTSHIAGAVLKNVHAFILLIDNDFKVLKTNYYQKTGTRKGTEEKRVGDLLQCRNALAAEGGCGTHSFCGSCPIRTAIRQAFEQRRNFTDLEATLSVVMLSVTLPPTARCCTMPWAMLLPTASRSADWISAPSRALRETLNI